MKIFKRGNETEQEVTIPLLREGLSNLAPNREKMFEWLRSQFPYYGKVYLIVLINVLKLTTTVKSQFPYYGKVYLMRCNSKRDAPALLSQFPYYGKVYLI